MKDHETGISYCALQNGRQLHCLDLDWVEHFRHLVPPRLNVPLVVQDVEDATVWMVELLLQLRLIFQFYLIHMVDLVEDIAWPRTLIALLIGSSRVSGMLSHCKLLYLPLDVCDLGNF